MCAPQQQLEARDRAEAELKEVNVALMERLAAARSRDGRPDEELLCSLSDCVGSAEAASDAEDDAARAYMAPAAGSLAYYRAQVEALPHDDAVGRFGMHENAAITHGLAEAAGVEVPPPRPKTTSPRMAGGRRANAATPRQPREHKLVHKRAVATRVVVQVQGVPGSARQCQPTTRPAAGTRPRR